MAVPGTAATSATAHHLHLDETTTTASLLSYNGCLVGCAASFYLAPSSELLDFFTVTVAGAAPSTYVTSSLSKTLTLMPQWTVAFNLVTLPILLRARPSTTSEPYQALHTVTSLSVLPTCY